jgi:hypothetical protein
MPNISTPRLKEFARRLVVYETAGPTPVGAQKSAAFRVCEKLRQPLSRLAGLAGFRSLLSRALALANDEARWMKAIHIKADGSLEGLDEAQAQLAEDEIAEGEVVLIAQLIGLLVTFIGEELTLRLVQESWPDAPFDDMNA